MRKQERLGLSFTNKYGETYTITTYNNANDVEITFTNGCIVHTSWSNCKNGGTRSPYAKTVFGVGFLGEGHYKSRPSTNEPQTKEYCLWKRMMQRCYDINNPRKYNDVVVCERWHNFQLFCEDLPKIYGYDKWVTEEGYCLDKDLKQKDVKVKVYSLDTCIFVKNEDNIKEMLDRVGNNKHCVVAIDEMTGSVNEYESIREASRVTGLNYSVIRKCCHNTYGVQKNLYKNKRWFFKGEMNNERN